MLLSVNNIGDKVKITNVQSLTKKDMKILSKNKYICTIEDVDILPTNKKPINSIYTVELKGAIFLTGDFKLLTT